MIKRGKLTIDAAKGHAAAGANKGGEGLAVGSDELAALPGVLLLFVKVKDKVVVIGEESKSVGGTVGKFPVRPSL